MGWVDNNSIGNHNIIYNGCCGTEGMQYWMLRLQIKILTTSMKPQALVKTDVSYNAHIN